MQVLAILQYPGHLRYYDTVLAELASRGHQVRLYFDQPHKQPEGLAALGDGIPGIEVGEALPKRSDRWDPFARGVRGTLDYLKYLHPEFAGLVYLRRRWEKFLPPPARPISRLSAIAPATFRRGTRLLRHLESAIPSDPRFEGFLESVNPDVILVSPYITTFYQSDLVKAAHRMGIPTLYGVASWDNLTTKGQIRVPPDAILVWNELQRKEVAKWHLIDPAIVEVTGAHNFDRWFARRASTSRAEFCSKVGLPADRPFVLFVGSTASISAPEAERGFVRRWVVALRSADDSLLRDVGVLVRPHPYNSAHWRPEDIKGLEHVAIWPPWGANPVDDEDRADFYDSMHHSAAVVGINTSAMLESAIVGRPVFTIRDPQFTDTQDGTIHFRYLLRENGGPVEAATSIGDHLSQLQEALTDPASAGARARQFVERFLRPNGIERPATSLSADAVERVAGRRKKARRPSPRLLALRAAVWPAAAISSVLAPLPVIASRWAHHRLPDPLRRRVLVWNKRRRARWEPNIAPPARAPERQHRDPDAVGT